MAIKEYCQKANITLLGTKVKEKPKFLQIILNTIKGTKVFYNILLANESLPNCCVKWSETVLEPCDWMKVFEKIHKVKEIKLKWFQIRLFHRILATNIVLQKMQIVESNLCSFCKSTKETIHHLFWICTITQKFWTDFERLINSLDLAPRLTLSKELILFGTDGRTKTDEILDLILLLVKCYIYKCKYENSVPHLIGFKHYLKYKYEIDEYISKINMEVSEFKQKWCGYIPLVECN